MEIDPHIPPSIVAAKEKSVPDPMLKEVSDLEKTVEEKERSLRHMRADLLALKDKRRKELKLAHRENAIWCLEIDEDNPFYFLKSSKGVAMCIAFKNSIDADADLKSKTATALSWLYLNGQIGRVDYNDKRYYGVLKHFKKDGSGLYSVFRPSKGKELENLREVMVTNKK